MKKTIIAILGLLVSLSTVAQHDELIRDLSQDTVVDEYGKNRKHYVGSNFSVGVGAGSYSTAPSFGRKNSADNSLEWQGGLYYKRKLSNFYALGLELRYTYQSYELVPIGDETNNEYINNLVELVPFQRFNFKLHRGNKLGMYMDIGFFGGWNVVHKQRIIEKPKSGNQRKITTERAGIKGVNDFQYGPEVRLMYEYVGLYGRYHLNSIYNQNVIGFNPPPLVIGCRLSY